MNQIICSTGAFIGSLNQRNYGLVMEANKVLKCDGFEFMMYPSWYGQTESIAESLCRSGAQIYSFHMDKDIGELVSKGLRVEALEAFEVNCRLARDIKAGLLVLHLWGGRASDGNIGGNISMYPIFRDMAEKYGLLLTIENVVCNQENPLKHMKTLYDKFSDISFTIDTRFTEFHRQYDELYDEKSDWLWQGAVKHVHFSDYLGGYMDWSCRDALQLGKGQIDFERFTDFLECKSYQGAYVLESTCIEAGLNHELLNHNLTYLKMLGK